MMVRQSCASRSTAALRSAGSCCGRRDEEPEEPPAVGELVTAMYEAETAAMARLGAAME
jgi:hypothetical protein